MAYEVNIKAEDRKDAMRKAILEFGISNLVDEFYDWLDAIETSYGVNDFEDSFDIMCGGEHTIRWFATLCVDNDTHWYDVDKKTFTLEQAKEIIEIENKIKDIVFGKGGES